MQGMLRGACSNLGIAVGQHHRGRPPRATRCTPTSAWCPTSMPRSSSAARRARRAARAAARRRPRGARRLQERLRLAARCRPRRCRG
ncbi:MAG: hypothetical protein MZW92_36765 [Comamonadaceae bacterium]|nr:hypothetical protein [Comamonadaceae bacterium]